MTEGTYPAGPSQRLDLTIRPYRDDDERGWLRCSVLAFLETAYFDSVYQEKPRYDHPAIELVAERDGAIVGVIDVECEDVPGSVCTVCALDNTATLGGMIWHLAVHPDHQRQGVGSALLAEATRLASPRGIACLEAWTRDDPGTLRWYESHGFQWVRSYLHVYAEETDETQSAIRSLMPDLKPARVFAHYTGDDPAAIRARFKRVHECNCYRLTLGDADAPSQL